MSHDVVTFNGVSSVLETAAFDVVVEKAPSTVVVEVARQGPPGTQGDAGPSGGAYEHTQAVASDTWTVNHNLGYRPAASLLTVGGKEMWAEVIHTSANQFIAYFDAPIAGVAICS